MSSFKIVSEMIFILHAFLQMRNEMIMNERGNKKRLRIRIPQDDFVIQI